MYSIERNVSQYFILSNLTLLFNAALFASMLSVLDDPILLNIYVITNHFLKRKIMNSLILTNLYKCNVACYLVQ